MNNKPRFRKCANGLWYIVYFYRLPVKHLSTYGFKSVDDAWAYLHASPWQNVSNLIADYGRSHHQSPFAIDFNPRT